MILEGNCLFLDSGDPVVNGGLAVRKLNHVADVEAVHASYCGAVAVYLIDLGLDPGNGRYGDLYAVAPLAGIPCSEAQDGVAPGGSTLCVRRAYSHDKGTGATVDEKVLYRIGQEALVTIPGFGKVTAENAHIIAEAGNQLRFADHAALLCKTDKACCACADAFHRNCARLVLLNINTGG